MSLVFLARLFDVFRWLTDRLQSRLSVRIPPAPPTSPSPFTIPRETIQIRACTADLAQLVAAENGSEPRIQADLRLVLSAEIRFGATRAASLHRPAVILHSVLFLLAPSASSRACSLVGPRGFAQSSTHLGRRGFLVPGLKAVAPFKCRH
jgi:hypothetical protein